MSRKATYEDCLNFIENKLNIKLLDFQKEILKYILENKEVRTGRGCGRKMIADAYGKYMAHLHSENDYSVEPDAVFPTPTQNKLLGSRVEHERLPFSSKKIEVYSANGYNAKFRSVDEHWFNDLYEKEESKCDPDKVKYEFYENECDNLFG